VTSADASAAARRRRDVAIAGHIGQPDLARSGLDDDDPGVRSSALGALDRLERLDVETLRRAATDPHPSVRRRAASLAAGHPTFDLAPLLDDEDDHVVEVAAWAAGEHESSSPPIVDRLLELATNAADALVREAAVAALGAIGDERAIPTIVEATHDKPTVRRRAILAVAPFVGEASVDEALDRALSDRDWQVRQAAEDICRAAGRPTALDQNR